MNKKATILGAIAGDTIGSIYEFNPTKDYNFTLLHPIMEYTDDSIMTIAIAQWIMEDSTHSLDQLASIMRYWGHKYPFPMGGYGNGFFEWLFSTDPQPYNSWGNGSAMRVSACGFAFPTMEETLKMARLSAEITHNHPEGIKGAEATAAAIFMARHHHSKEEIRQYITEHFGYDLNQTYQELLPTYRFYGSCQETVPQALIAFFDSNDYESAIRQTVSLGGDADTMGAITGAVAAAFYGGIPEEIYDFTMSRLPNDLKEIVVRFESKY